MYNTDPLHTHTRITGCRNASRALSLNSRRSVTRKRRKQSPRRWNLHLHQRLQLHLRLLLHRRSRQRQHLSLRRVRPPTQPKARRSQRQDALSCKTAVLVAHVTIIVETRTKALSTNVDHDRALRLMNSQVHTKKDARFCAHAQSSFGHKFIVFLAFLTVFDYPIKRSDHDTTRLYNTTTHDVMRWK